MKKLLIILVTISLLINISIIFSPKIVKYLYAGTNYANKDNIENEAFTLVRSILFKYKSELKELKVKNLFKVTNESVDDVSKHDFLNKIILRIPSNGCGTCVDNVINIIKEKLTNGSQNRYKILMYSPNEKYSRILLSKYNLSLNSVIFTTSGVNDEYLVESLGIPYLFTLKEDYKMRDIVLIDKKYMNFAKLYLNETYENN